MTITMRDYDHEKDFLRVRDFLVTTYAHFRRSYNWTIERWNFAASVARTMHAISLEDWAAQIAIWEADGVIQAVATSEGEDAGEVFFQLRSAELPESILTELFAFAAERMGKVEGDARKLQLFVPAGDARLEAMADAHGYARQDWRDHDGVLTVGDALPIALPDGYTLADGTAITAAEMGAAHAAAFGYAGEAPWTERIVVGFERMRTMPDYRADLSLHVRAPDGSVACFAQMWLDGANRIGILEPVGTVPAHRKLGLGRAAIYEAINRIRAEGATRVHVGSDQRFYQRLGFVVRDKYTVWEKRVRL